VGDDDAVAGAVPLAGCGQGRVISMCNVQLL